MFTQHLNKKKLSVSQVDGLIPDTEISPPVDTHFFFFTSRFLPM